ncbi:MAG: AmmeMemoRadiSam system protein B [bacterium]|nr:AmmeMemoRadiSam system protein B [bacterium]
MKKFSALSVFGLLVLAAILLFIGEQSTVSPSEKFHVSMYYESNSDFFASSLKPFASVKPLTPSPRIFIVNQHILAASLIAHQFALSTDPRVTTVVLITQNNWNAGEAPVITSREAWKTPLGTIEPNTNLAEVLISANLASPEEQIFVHEHGITGIVPYVANAFPNARIVPLVIRDKTPDAVIDGLAEKLGDLDLAHTVIIGTIDMSHYLPRYLADAHDRKTEQAIEHFDYGALPTLDIDTAPTLRAIMKVAEHAGEKTFTVTGHANSADITNQPELLSTTSYLTGYFSRGPSATGTEPVHILFTGDVMLDRNVALHAKAVGDQALIAQVERMFLGVDATIANLEGTITTNPSISIPDNSRLQFTFDPHFAGFLKNIGITAVSLSNNHTFDFGQSGYGATKNFLANAGIHSFGSPHNDDTLSTKIELRGKNLCFVGYEGFVAPDPAPITAEIRRIRPSCDVLVATMHAGEEYFMGYTNQQKEVAHAFIDAGADVVIGTHPHVVEPLEIYKGKAIFYSLGNFIFDQNFSYETTHGLAVSMEWGGEETRYTLIPITIQHEEVSFSDTVGSIKTLSALIDNNLPRDIKSAILNAYSFTLK